MWSTLRPTEPAGCTQKVVESGFIEKAIASSFVIALSGPVLWEYILEEKTALHQGGCILYIINNE